jgi:hypothetical protein
MEWNGRPLSLILDHKNGVNSDNSPENLRFLCPNCDSQQTETRGGANIGRVRKSGAGFGIFDRKTGRTEYIIRVEAGQFAVTGSPANFVIARNDKKS